MKLFHQANPNHTFYKTYTKISKKKNMSPKPMKPKDTLKDQ